jgi:hypothetical protein
MRWYLLSCPQCGWKSPPVGQAAAEAMATHRCRICLIVHADKPEQVPKFQVREVTSSLLPHHERKGEL